MAHWAGGQEGRVASRSAERYPLPIHLSCSPHKLIDTNMALDIGDLMRQIIKLLLI